MNNLVRVSLHAEMQKFGKRYDPRKPLITDMVERDDVKTTMGEKNIQTIGLDLSYSENRALFAVQKLLSDTDYKGNTKPLSIQHMELPGMEIKISDYLKAYGVKKYKTGRGKMEFSGTERKTAIKALTELTGRHFLFAYDRTNWGKKGAQTQERVEMVSPVIMARKENSRHLSLYPSPVLMDQINTYFVWMPSDLFERAGKDQTAVLFIEYLLCQAEQKRRSGRKYVIDLAPETLARVLRLDSLISTRQWNRVRDKLNNLYNVGKEIGYIEEYSVALPGVRVREVDRLCLNKKAIDGLRIAA